MWRPQLKTDVDANGNRGFHDRYRPDIFLDTTLRPTHLGHGGDQNGFISYIDFDPKKRKVSILVFNTTVTLPRETPRQSRRVSRLRRAVHVAVNN